MTWSIHQPPPPGRTETEDLGVHEEDLETTPTPPLGHTDTAESEVREGEVVTPPPTKTDRDSGAAVRTVGTEVGHHKERLIGGVGKSGYLG